MSENRGEPIKNRNRYARQMVLPQVGLSGQMILFNSKVLLVGAGGLGLPCAQSLVAAGVGQLTIIDDDHVSLTNLQRQSLYTEADIGRYKVEVLAEKLLAQNSDVKILTLNERLSRTNVLQLVQEHDLIIDGSDNFTTKFLINDACLLQKKPWVYGSVSRFEGQIAVFYSHKSEMSCYRCLYPKIPTSKIENCAEQGVLGAVTGIIGNYQALEALKVLIRLKQNQQTQSFISLKNNILQIFDFQSLDQQSLRIPKREACLCANPNQIKLQEEEFFCGIEFEKTWQDFNEDHQKKMLFDVRTAQEFEMDHHGQAQLWDESLIRRLTENHLEVDGPIYLYCATGVRARAKCLELRGQGVLAYCINSGLTL